MIKKTLVSMILMLSCAQAYGAVRFAEKSICVKLLIGGEYVPLRVPWKYKMTAGQLKQVCFDMYTEHEHNKENERILDRDHYLLIKQGDLYLDKVSIPESDATIGDCYILDTYFLVHESDVPESANERLRYK